ncbi:MAG: hypothetical protein ABI806_22570 [Candidatus Solibacter sp.]
MMTVEFEDSLWARVKRHAEAAGFSSPEQFVQDAVKRQIDNASSPEEDQLVMEKLQGLGYLDHGRDI